MADEWNGGTYTIQQLRKMFIRPISTAEMRKDRLGDSTEKVRRFREKNMEVTVLDGTIQLQYVRGWFERLPIKDRTAHDYFLFRRIQLQQLELQAQTRTSMLAVAKALRTLATQYADSAEELETHYAEENTDETDGSVHSSEST